MVLVGDATLKQLDGLHPEAAQELRRLSAAVTDCGIDPTLLELCDAFFEAEISGQPWTPGRELTALESACISLCGQFATSVSTMEDGHVAPLAEVLDADQLYNLMSALYLIESSKRLEVTLRRVLP